MPRQRKMILGSVVRGCPGYIAGWRHKDLTREMLQASSKLGYYTRIAEISEKAKLHFLFLADSPTVTYLNVPYMLEHAAQDYYLEPMTMLAAMIPGTKHIGLVGSMSTTYADPYTVARTLASLDHLSNGRASWNIVTTGNPTSAQNFSYDMHPDKGDRYARAEEFVRIVKGLWDSYEDDAFVRDQKSGRFLDPSKMHYLNHKSENFSVRGPLNVERCPQGYPVLLVAGASDRGKELAAETGDALFTAQPDKVQGRAFYQDVKGRMAKYGRSPDELAILPGAMIIVGETDAEAKAKRAYLRSLIDIEFAVAYTSSLAGMDLSHLPLDQPLPDSLRSQPVWSRLELMMDVAERDHLNFRELAIQYTETYGHQFMVGSPKTIADELEDLFESEVADGFLLRSPIFPQGLEDTANLLIPELQRRGLAQPEYAGKTFRENLGLKRPEHPAAAARRGMAAE
jgi:FMN-dependent oxidoreductase (nitrilotriacetate monooxygenase family)